MSRSGWDDFSRFSWEDHFGGKKGASRRRRIEKCVVYFIQEGIAGNIKIGVSMYPEGRRRKLQTGNSKLLSIVATFPGAEKEEDALHKAFAHLHTSGEWYKPARELLDKIEELTGKQLAPEPEKPITDSRQRPESKKS